MSGTRFTEEFFGYAIEKLGQNYSQIRRCVKLLGDAELWRRENEHCNSVGNLLLHLNGNVRQWILGGLDAQTVRRNRPAEFAERGPLPGAELVDMLGESTQAACHVIAGARREQLTNLHTIQGYAVSGVEVVFHVVEHYSFHTGQIVHITKALKNVDLSLYDAQGRRTGGPGKP